MFEKIPDAVDQLAHSQPVWVRSTQALEQVIEDCLSEPSDSSDSCLPAKYVAVDTEFERTSTYFANAGLIQLATESQVFLIDPLEVQDIRPIAALLESESVIKVLHSMSEDIELLRNLCGVEPRAVFDTQLAATFLNLGTSMGYQRLVAEVFDIQLDKSETRSDWLKRPLSASQVEYAVKDTAYLRALYQTLSQRLNAKQLRSACMDECRFVISQIMDSWDNPDNAYLKLRGAWALPVDQQLLLKDLVCWRDATAVKQNIPKSWVFADAILISALEFNLQSPKELFRLKGIKSRSVRQFGDELMQRIQDFQVDSAALVDFERIEGPIKGRELELYKVFKSLVNKVAHQQDLPAQLLAARKHMEAAVVALYRKKQSALPAVFSGWRADYLAEPLMQATKNYVRELS